MTNDRPYTVQITVRDRSVVIGRYNDPNHAKRDAQLARISYPRAHRVGAYGPAGPLLTLRRRGPVPA